MLTQEQQTFARLLRFAPPAAKRPAPWDQNIVAQAEADAALYRACHSASTIANEEFSELDFFRDDDKCEPRSRFVITEEEFLIAFDDDSFVPTTFRENGEDLRGDLADVWLRLQSATTKKQVMGIINGEIIPNIPHGWGMALLSDIVRACKRVGSNMDMSRLQRADAMAPADDKRKRFVS